MLSLEELKDVVPDPVYIVKELDKYVVGQEQAKKTLAICLLNRAILKLEKHGKIYLENRIDKNNVLMLGPTGVGKTSLIRAIQHVADMHITLFDVTSLTSQGYVGGDVEDVLVKHVDDSDSFLREYAKLHEDLVFSTDYGSYMELLEDYVETGMIYLDEIDKLRIAKDATGDRDINGEAVQNELLKFLEAGDVDITRGKQRHTKSGMKVVRTNNILFICGGAFTGLEDIIQNRLSKSSGIGFASDLSHKIFSSQDKSLLFDYVTTEDLIEFGFKPEFLGRIALRCSLRPLTNDMYMAILKESKGSVLHEYKSFFHLFGIDLHWTDGALSIVIEEAKKLKTGARSLRSLITRSINSYVFNILNYDLNTLVITEDVIKKELGLN